MGTDVACKVIRGVIYAGSGFNGSVYGLAQQWTGLVEGINTSILNYESIFLMRSAFAIPCFDNSCVVDAKSGERLQLDLYDPSVWLNNRLAKAIDPNYNNPANMTVGTGTLDQRKAYLTATVLTARETRDAQYAQSGFNYPPFATICGDQFQTAQSILSRQDAFGLGLDYTNFSTVVGDGVVTWDSCQMQAGIPYTSVRSGKDHFSLLSDSNALTQAIGCIFG